MWCSVVSSNCQSNLYRNLKEIVSTMFQEMVDSELSGGDIHTSVCSYVMRALFIDVFGVDLFLVRFRLMIVFPLMILPTDSHGN